VFDGARTDANTPVFKVQSGAEKSKLLGTAATQFKGLRNSLQWESVEMKKLVFGILLGAGLVIAGAFFYFSLGFAPAAATDPPMMFEKRLAHMALSAHLDKEKKTDPPVPADEANYLAGAEVYKQHCAVCHGLPGQEKTAIAAGMYPPPPQLFHGVGVTDDPAWESYWKAQNGIRLTGMPGFKGRLTDKQLWQAALLLANADKIPASVKSDLVEDQPKATPGPAPAQNSKQTGKM
jgi:thiosulfate dehydrogenase